MREISRQRSKSVPFFNTPRYFLARMIMVAIALGVSLGAANAAPAPAQAVTAPVSRPATARDEAIRRIAIAAAKRNHGLPPGVPVPEWALRPGQHPYFLPAPGGPHGGGLSGTSALGAFADAQEETGEENGSSVIEDGPEEPAGELPDSNELGLRCGASYCAVPPLRYLGGVVQHNPKVHLIFWGSNWQSGIGNEARLQLLSMFEGLSNSAYQGIFTQYFDTTGRVSSTVNITSVVDTRVAAPTGVDDAAIQSEVSWAVAGYWKREPDAQFMVLTAPGTTYASSFYSGFCAYHSVDSSGSVFSIVPYAGDSPFGTQGNCDGYYGRGSANDATSVMASHEYGESATDPRWDTTPGWKSLDGKEVTDICATPGDKLASGAVVQGQYDDHQNACSLSDKEPPHVLALTDNPSNVSRYGGTIHATINPEGLPTTYRLEYGTSTAYGTSVPSTGEASAGSGMANVEAEARLSGLTLGQTYHYRVSATNSTGTTYGEDRTFTPSYWLIRPQPAEPSSTASWLNDVSCASEQFCMAVGHYFSGENRPLAYKKVGHIWSAAASVPMPTGAQNLELNGVSCSSADACTAVGGVSIPAIAEDWLPAVMRWNGSSWSEQSLSLPSGSTGKLKKVSCPSRTECVAVGRIANAEGERNYSAVWRNGSWNALSTPTAAESTYAILEDVSCGAPEWCMAVGWYNPGVGAGKPTVVTLNGSTWTTRTPADNNRGRYGVTCISSSSCTTVGVENRIESWNGTTLTKMTPPELTDVAGAILLDVSCVSASDCTAVGGGNSKLNGRNLTVAERWNGTAWSVETTPRPSERARNEFSAVSCLPLECTAAGFSLESGHTKSLIEARRMPDLTSTFSQTIGSNGTGSGNFDRPWGLTVDSAGNLWVADKLNNRVEEFNSKGEFVLMFGLEVNKTTKGNICTAASGNTCGVGIVGSGNGAFSEPLDVAVTSGGDLWVTDRGNKRVQKFNSKGEYLAQFGSSGNGNGQFTEPWGIDIAADGSIWVADALYYRVQQFSSAGSWIRTVAVDGPRGVAADPEGHIWVTDRANNRIIELSSTGARLSEFGSPGSGEGQFSEPQSIAVASTGDLLVGDRLNNRVQQFSPDGDYERQMAPFSEVRGVAVGQSGVLYISDTSMNRVQKYQQTARPEVTTLAATELGEAGATVRGSLNPGGLQTTYYFEYGLSTDYGARTAEKAASSGHITEQVSAALSGLKPNTTYHVRLVGSNSDGVSRGKDETFTTEGRAAPGLTGMPITEPFNATTESLASFNTNWSAWGWAGGTTPKGEDMKEGWRPVDAYPTVNGIYYGPTLTDLGSGVGAAVTMTANPGSLSRYFSLWLDATSGSARNGYELRFLLTATNTYTVTLAKWEAGKESLLATKTGYSFVNGNSLAMADEGGSVSAWTDTGAGFKQLLTANDSAFAAGKSGMEAAGYTTRLRNFKVGALLPAVSGMPAALDALPVRDAFATNEKPLSGGGAWAALAWDNSETGHNTGQVEGGWGPYNTYPVVNGAYWTKASLPDTGSGTAAAATLIARPASAAGRYFSLNLAMPSPASAHTGYELRFTETSANVYDVVLAKWVSGTKTSLATKTAYSLPLGSKFALTDRGGTVSAWTKLAGGEYAQILTAADSSFSNGYAGLEGSGSNTRLSEFRAGPLSPF